MVVRQALMAASNSDVVHTAATTTPLTKSVARRFVAGDREADAVAVAAELAASGMHCTIEYLGDSVETVQDCTDVVTANLRLLDALGTADLLDRSEISIQLSDLGLDQINGVDIAYENAHRIVKVATESDTFVTIDAEKYSRTDEVAEVVRRLRADFPKTGIVVQANLRDSEITCAQQSRTDSRVRLVKGAYDEPDNVAYDSSQEIALSYVRCLKALMAGNGYPMIATHDPRLIEIATALAIRTGRERQSYEFQMLYGVSSAEQKRLAASGERVRIFVPYGPGWYPYLVRRMAERPSNLALFVRALSRR